MGIYKKNIVNKLKTFVKILIKIKLNYINSRPLILILKCYKILKSIIIHVYIENNNIVSAHSSCLLRRLACKLPENFMTQ